LLKNIEWKPFIAGSLAAILVTAFFVVWAEKDPQSLLRYSLEDGPVENVTAALFGLACTGLIVMMFRSPLLREGKGWYRYLFLVGWALLMFVFFGEEISWGQRILGFSAPDVVAAANAQNEFNLHNLEVLQTAKYRLLSLLMLFTGVVFPCAALFERVRALFQRLVFPVLPMAYSGFFVCSYLYGKLYYDKVPGDGATEVRELLMALGIFAFALHGSLRSNDVFRIRR